MVKYTIYTNEDFNWDTFVAKIEILFAISRNFYSCFLQPDKLSNCQNGKLRKLSNCQIVKMTNHKCIQNNNEQQFQDPY